MKHGEMLRKHGGQFIPVTDSRNRKIQGLFQRNNRFYGLLWCEDADGLSKKPRRFPLRDPETGEPCATVNSAKAAMEVLRQERRENRLPAGGRKPTFEQWKETYLQCQVYLRKKVRTQNIEKDALGRWSVHFGNLRIDRILTPYLKSFVEKRLKGQLEMPSGVLGAVSPRTVELDIIALRNCLKEAIDTGHLTALPRFPSIDVPPPPRRSLISWDQFQNLLKSAVAMNSEGIPVTKNGVQLADYLQFLAFTGAREKESLRVTWDHVDFKNGRIFIGAPEDFRASRFTIGSGGESKNRGSRIVEFNPQLEALLKEMKTRRAPDSKWLFPSPQRGDKDRPSKTLRESLRLVRKHAGLPHLGFHDLRHLFCSHCVMAGIDYMTIAGWVGHKDGGILIGKVYGHLNDEHRHKMAAKVVIGG